MRVWILAIISALVLSNVSLQETRAIASQPKDWTAEVRRSISEREYEATDAGEGLQAPNRAHDLRTYFDAGGARVVGREDAKELARLRTVAVGGAPVEAGEVVTSGARVEVRRAGLVEWYENTERGLEQGWTVERRPANGLSVELDLGGATARVENGRAVLDANGRRLEYGGLEAWDADGRELAARMESAGERLRIEVDDAGAVYPVTIDPTLTSPAFATIESDQVNGLLGSVAGAGDVNGDGYDDVIVGCYGYDAGQTDEGAAFVFLGGPAGVAGGSPATAAATLQSDLAGALFGFSAAGAGDVNGDGYDDVIVGAPSYSSGQSNEGGAFVFLGGPAGIASGNVLSAAVLESDQTGSNFGVQVSCAGDVDRDGYDDVVVGANNFDNVGGVFLFRGGPAGVADGTPATAASALRSDRASSAFGGSVAGAGDTNGDGYDDVIVGAAGYSDGPPNQGAVFVFNGSPNGLLGADPGAAAASYQASATDTRLGSGVAGAGDVNADGYDDVIFGADGYDGGETNEGAAYVYLGGPNGLQFAAFYEGNQPEALFGAAVAGAGDVNGDGFDDVAVGALSYDGRFSNSGGAFVFFGGPGPLTSGSPRTAASAVVSGQYGGSGFGIAVAGAGDVDGDGYDDLIVNESLYGDGQTFEGAAFVYSGGPYGLAGYPSPAATLESNQPSASFGFSVAGGGDVNGDGYDDVVVGALNYDSGQTDEGAAFVFLGGPAGIANGSPGTAAAVLQGDQPDARFGTSVSIAADVNGDGYSDVVVGAYLYEAGQTNEGAAFVFLGGPAGIANGSAATAAATLQSDQADSLFGYELSAAGDVNNDGYDDVIVSALNYDSGQTNEGAAFVFLGGASGVASGTPATAATTIQSDQASALLGWSVSGAGDVNNDGYDDVIVGALSYDSGQTNEGAAFVFLGGASGVTSATPATAATTIQSDQDSASVASVAGAGDVNGDGYDDVVVGVPGYDSGQTNEGAAFVFLGGPSGIANGSPATAATTLQSDNAGELFGDSVASAGDVDGDAYADIVVSSLNYNVGFGASGGAFVFRGGPAGIPSGTSRSAAVTMTVGQNGANFGTGVAGAGDVNGDGRDDVIVGASGYDSGQSNEGGAFVYMPGTCCRGRASSDSVGVYSIGAGAWFLRDSNNPGPAHTTFTYGAGGAGYVPIAGDWDGDGIDSPGLYDPGTGAFFLRNSSTPGPADVTFVFGAGGRVNAPVAGDWNGDGTDTVGVYNAASGVFFLRNANAAGPADVTFGFGPAGVAWRAIAGDWDGNGSATVGLYDPVEGVFFLTNANGSGPADLAFNFGPVLFGYLPLAGDFNGDDRDTVGLYNPATGAFFLKNSNTFGGADVTFGFGPPNATPLVGDWDGRLHRAEPNTTQNRER